MLFRFRHPAFNFRHPPYFLVPICLFALSGCYFVDYFQTDPGRLAEKARETSKQAVLGLSLGSRAGGVNEAALETLYAVSGSKPPASVRPDPDLYARRLLLQFRQEGSRVARLIGDIEAFRPLLGGASETFLQAPQEEFDATSLLATLSIADTLCQSLVAPSSDSSEGDSWSTILPASASSTDENLRFLAQRITGRSPDSITAEYIAALKTIMDNEKSANSESTPGSYSYADYVPVCSVLTIDPQAQNL